MMNMEIGIRINLDELLRYLYDNNICPDTGFRALLRIGCEDRNFKECCKCWSESVEDYFRNLQMSIYDSIRDLSMED